MIASCIGLAVSCTNTPDTTYLAIDNPTNKPLSILIDTVQIEVPAQNLIWQEISKGEHAITFQEDSVITYDFKEDTCFLNPTLTEYLMYKQMYSPVEPMASYKDLDIEYFGITARGQYRVLNDLINPISWHYGPREPLPVDVYVTRQQPYNELTKIADPIEGINHLTLLRFDIDVRHLKDSLEAIYR